MKIEVPALDLAGIRHGFFTRHGGVSDGVYGSLNIGFGSSDDPARIAENRSRVAEAMGVARDRLVTPWQYHSDVTLAVEKPWEDDDRPKADAVVTAQPGIALGVTTADCTPVLLADAEARVVGGAHAGWRGALAGVLESVVVAMEGLGADRKRIVAVIGPTISQVNYEVGEDFREQFLDIDAENERYFATPPGKRRPHFDLPRYSSDRLTGCGVGTVVDIARCTYAEEDMFFSYRRTTHRGEHDYGRLVAAIALV